MNGCQFALFTYIEPNPITSRTIATLTTTMTLLKLADSLIPMTRSVDMATTRSTAGRLMTPPGTRSMVCVTGFQVSGAAVNAAGNRTPTPFRKSIRWPDHPDGHGRRAEEILEDQDPSQ